MGGRGEDPGRSFVSIRARLCRTESHSGARRSPHPHLFRGRIPGGWACSSAGQSARLISVRSEVQVFPGPPRSESSFRLRLKRPDRRVGKPQLGGISSVGRAPGLQPGGHRFEPGILQGRREAQRGSHEPRSNRGPFPTPGGAPAPSLPTEGAASGAPLSINGSVWQFQGALQRRWRKDRETRRVPPGTLRFRGQVTKGARWMPWRRKAMKDVADCDKPRGAVSRLRSGDFRMG